MRFSDYILISLQNIWRQKLRSALTIFAVVIGATSVTIMLALVTGAKGFFTSQFEANGVLQQVVVSPKADITNYDEAQHGGGGNCDSCVKLTDIVANKIEALPHATGLARVLTSGSVEAIKLGDKKLTVNQVKGYDTNGVITRTMVAGRDLDGNDKTGVITVSSDYADKLGFKSNYGSLVGKKVDLITRNWYTGIGADIPKPQMQPGANNEPNNKSTVLSATVVGVSDSNSDSQVVRAPLDWVHGMNMNQMWQPDEAYNQAAQEKCQRRTPGPCNVEQKLVLVSQDMVERNGYDSFVVKADATSNTAGLVTEIKKLGVGAADAQSYIQSQIQIFNIVGLVLGGIGGIALLVAAIGVINTMVMAILERTREIGVMRACGAKRSTVRALFTFEASLLGFLGGIVGIAVGYGLTRIANVFINKQLASNSFQVHNIIALPLWLIVTVIAATTVIGFFAGLYPASRAARLNPVDALRYE